MLVKWKKKKIYDNCTHKKSEVWNDIYESISQLINDFSTQIEQLVIKMKGVSDVVLHYHGSQTTTKISPPSFLNHKLSLWTYYYMKSTVKSQGCWYAS